ncbi:hypothetical protein [Clostridium tertium]|uniref:hypothetical protein n=1 Tax=Clostridium tertium TaxID=1559 RepID=UPI0012E81921
MIKKHKIKDIIYGIMPLIIIMITLRTEYILSNKVDISSENFIIASHMIHLFVQILLVIDLFMLVKYWAKDDHKK